MSDDIINLYKSLGGNNQESRPKQRQLMPRSATTYAPATETRENHFKRSISSLTPSEAFNLDNIASTKRKRKEKCSKGLRHFSMKVCEKVKQKSVTSYNEVADELVNEYCGFTSTYSTNDVTSSSSGTLDFWSYDQKNVRRRVYDALNVLMAMNIISKEKKEIKWIGLPCNKKQECQDFEAEKKKKEEAIALKSEHLKDLILEQIALKILIERNKQLSVEVPKMAIEVPFLVMNTDEKTQVDFTISSDRKEYLIQFDNTFEVNTHLNVLSNLNMTIKSTNAGSSVKTYAAMLPKLFEPYIEQIVGSKKLEPICFPINLPNYSNLTSYEKDLSVHKVRKTSSKISPKSMTDQGNESDLCEDEEELQMSNDENDSDDNEDIIGNNFNEEDISDEENTEDENDDENSLADSLSF